MPGSDRFPPCLVFLNYSGSTHEVYETYVEVFPAGSSYEEVYNAFKRWIEYENGCNPDPGQPDPNKALEAFKVNRQYRYGNYLLLLGNV